MNAGRVAVITGASSGIGRAITEDLLGRGVAAHLLSRKLDWGADLEAIAARAGGQVHRHRVDLADADVIAGLITDLNRELSSVDLLIYSAGLFRYGGIEDGSCEDFDLQMAVNARAAFLLARGLLPLLRAARGQIVFVNSSAVHAASPRIGPYTASKAALKALADCLRAEVNADGIRVISVFPGRTASPMQEAVHRSELKRYEPEKLLQPADVAAAVMAALEASATAEITDLRIRPMRK